MRKLVRDNIPELIEQSGKKAIISYSNDIVKSLKEKLVEEANEVNNAGYGDLVEELADVYTVFKCLLKESGISMNMVIVEADIKEAMNGGFDKHIILEGVE